MREHLSNITKSRRIYRDLYTRRRFKPTVQPLPKVKFLINFFHRNRFFEWTHFSHVGRKGLKFDLALKETDFFFRLCAQQRGEKNHIERDREKWCHKSFWRNRARKIFSVSGAEPFGPSPGAIFLVVFFSSCWLATQYLFLRNARGFRPQPRVLAKNSRCRFGTFPFLCKI